MPSMDDREVQVRRDLAACFRFIARFGWDELIYTHASARVPGHEGEYLTNRFGVMFREVTASSLIRVGFDGKVREPVDAPCNMGAAILHGAVHAARPDVGCIIHTHTVAGIAVSAQAQGLRPVSQMSIAVQPRLAYHSYEGPAIDMSERARFVESLGGKSAMILRNHGLLTVADTVANAFFEMYYLEKACQVQIAALGGGAQTVTPPSSVWGRFGQAPTLAAGRGAPAWLALLRWLDATEPGYQQ